MPYNDELFRIGDRVIISDSGSGDTPQVGATGIIEEYHESDAWPWMVKFDETPASKGMYDSMSFETDELVLDASTVPLSFEEEILQHFAENDPDRVDNTKIHSGSYEQELDDWLRDLDDDWDISTGTSTSATGHGYTIQKNKSKSVGYSHPSWYGSGTSWGMGWPVGDKKALGNFMTDQVVRIVPSHNPDKKIAKYYGAKAVITSFGYAGAGEFPYNVTVEGANMKWQMAERELTGWIDEEDWILGKVVQTPEGEGRVVKIIPGHKRGDYVVSFATDPMQVYRFEHCKQFTKEDLTY